jgi:hypothetical protein
LENVRVCEFGEPVDAKGGLVVEESKETGSEGGEAEDGRTGKAGVRDDQRAALGEGAEGGWSG